MDSEPTEETPPEIQASPIGALARTRGVPGGMQAVPAEGASDPISDSDTTAVTTEPAATATSLLGISPETLAAVGTPAGAELSPAPPAPEAEPEPEPEAGVDAVPEAPPVEEVLPAPKAEVVEAVLPAPEAGVEAPLVEEALPLGEAPPVEAVLPAPEAGVVEEIPLVEEVAPPEVQALSEPELGAPIADPQLVDPPSAAPPIIQEEPDNLDDPKPDGVGRVILEWVVVLVGAVLMALILRQFIFQAFWIPSESMETTLEIRDRVLVNRLSYQWGEVGRGDVVVFARKPEETGEIRDLIKRVIGLGGDTVEGRDNAIYINGTRLDEPYVAPENLFFGDFGPVVVPEDELFVMGDNRDQSFDSRLFGTVHEDRVAGRAFVLFWPLDRVGAL